MKEAWFFCMPEVGSAGKKVCSSLHGPATDGFKHVTRGTTHRFARCGRMMRGQCPAVGRQFSGAFLVLS